MSRREAAGYRHVSVSTVQYWIDRYRSASEEQRADGSWAQDRPSTPIVSPPGSAPRYMTGCVGRARADGLGAAVIASELGMAHATVSRCLARRGMSRRPPAPREAVRR